MKSEEEECSLPYTPSNTGRRARVGYLGFEGVGFNDLWPVFAGIVLSLGIALKSFVGDGVDGSHWMGKTVLSLTPFSLGFGYLRFLVMGRPPHFRSDLLATALRVRVDFTDPPLRCFPLIPRICLDAAADCGPARAVDLSHPLFAKGRNHTWH